MRVVADTSVVVSALLWRGRPHQILLTAERGDATLYTSPALLDELSGVLARSKFASRLNVLRVTAEEVLASYATLTQVAVPRPIKPVIVEDPEDDEVLACAVTGRAHCIISGDSHLLTLKRYQSIPIVSPSMFFSAPFLRHPR